MIMILYMTHMGKGSLVLRNVMPVPMCFILALKFTSYSTLYSI